MCGRVSGRRAFAALGKSGGWPSSEIGRAVIGRFWIHKRNRDIYGTCQIAPGDSFPLSEKIPFWPIRPAIIGDVTVGRDCSIWFGAVLRGDVNKITVGDRVNIQDGVVVHTLYQRSVTEIGDDVSIGHNANIHGARIESRCLIGMGVTVLDHAVVGTGSIVAANSLVLSRTVIEPAASMPACPPNG